MKVRCFLIAVLIVFSLSGYAQAGVIGIPDRVPAATLIVPFFEVGIDAGANPHDTWPVVKNTSSSPVTVHYQVWDAYGNAIPDLNGNFTLNPSSTQPFSLRLLISGSSASSKNQITEGEFYRGFMTFDAVTVSTSMKPKDQGYPFASANVLEGYIYYVRLSQGSCNGMPMVSIEASSSPSMTGFYQASDNRERIDADARYSAMQLTTSPDPNNAIDRVDARVYNSPAFNAISRVIVFTFPKGGTCVNCGPGVVAYLRYDESGNVVENTTVNLNRIVNVINVSGTQNGDVSLQNIPGGWETYAFSTNFASPGYNPALTWDAIFEAFVNTQLEQNNTPPSGKTWTLSSVDYNPYGSAEVTLSTDPTNGLINLSWKVTTGHVWYCMSSTFVQGNNQFDISKFSHDADTALITPQNGWDGCSDIYAGVTKTATISYIPSWFNFNAPFKFIYDSNNWFVLQ